MQHLNADVMKIGGNEIKVAADANDVRIRIIRFQDRIAIGPVALITHSGSVFSALLRSRRELGFTLAVSSGQELVTPAAAYARYALSLPQTRVLGLVLEAIRDPGLLQQVLAAASAADIPVVLLTAGSSAAGRAMVAAHSGALAGQDGSWEALAGAYGVHRVSDFGEMADTLELFAIGRRVVGASGTTTAGITTGIATVHDSGLVSVIESFRDLCSDSEYFEDGKRATAESIGERFTLDQLHDEVVRPAVPPHVMKDADVGMIERGHQVSLALEASSRRDFVTAWRRRLARPSMPGFKKSNSEKSSPR